MSKWSQSVTLALLTLCALKLPLPVYAQAKPVAASKNAVKPFLMPIQKFGVNMPHIPVGNLSVLLPDKRQQVLSTDGLSSDVKVSASGSTVGWIGGAILAYRDSRSIRNRDIQQYFPGTICIWRPGAKMVRITPTKIYNVTWAFADPNGEHIAVMSEGSHGPDYMDLYDSHTGKKLHSYKIGDEEDKTWGRIVQAQRAREDEQSTVTYKSFNNVSYCRPVVEALIAAVRVGDWKQVASLFTPSARKDGVAFCKQSRKQLGAAKIEPGHLNNEWVNFSVMMTRTWGIDIGVDPVVRQIDELQTNDD